MPFELDRVGVNANNKMHSGNYLPLIVQIK